MKRYTITWEDPTGESTSERWTSQHLFDSIDAASAWANRDGNTHKRVVAIEATMPWAAAIGMGRWHFFDTRQEALDWANANSQPGDDWTVCPQALVTGHNRYEEHRS